tara:strand:- start:928 stop:2052 length:1125 start_codon:yes stop_codon:yes gene_type:complete
MIFIGQVCKKCVMDESDPNIYFDENKICNHCNYTKKQYELLPKNEEQSKFKLDLLVKKIKSHQKSEYDSIMGLSGGVDSSYVALIAKKLDLNPLVVHFDNGWNSELAVENIRKIVDTLGFDLETYVINWEEFKDLQRAFFLASVVDIELLTDHAITASLFKLAKDRKIKYILSGGNIATESGMPKAWTSRKSDFINIKDIHRKYGDLKLKTFPTMSSKNLLYNRIFNKREVIKILNSVVYKKIDAIKKLERELDWKYYGGKHYESTFTKFYQAYYLPEKFKIDKRKTHLSSLIRNGEISREYAIDELKLPLYEKIDFDNDYNYVLKKLGFSHTEFSNIMCDPIKDHNYYKSEENYLNKYTFLKLIYNFLVNNSK